MVFGTLGVGKSAILNKLADADVFAAKRSVKRVTTGFNLQEANEMSLLDAPGLGDLNMTLLEWAAKLNESDHTGKFIDLALLVIRQSTRPDA